MFKGIIILWCVLEHDRYSVMTIAFFLHHFQQGTVKPAPSFNAENDCKALREAMKGLGKEDCHFIATKQSDSGR